jgi:hypothetical protein
VRGRSLLDIVLRVTLEELHALEELRKKGRESPDGISAEELAAFWAECPALKWNQEQRYRRDVMRILTEIDSGNLPAAISADLAMRGAQALLSEVARRKASGTKLEPVQAQQVLREPYESDMLDGGRDAVLERWRMALDADPGGAADVRRQFHRTLATALRIVEDSGPGADAILFFTYLRAVVQGHYYVREEAEANSARGMFTPEGLVPAGALSYAAYLEKKGDAATLRRVSLAAVELWPDDAAIREMAQRAGEQEETAAKGVRQGPLYLDEAIKEEEAGG